MHRWIHPEKHRHYQATLIQDLFGEWTLVCTWGGLGTARGNYSITGVASHEAGLRRIEAIGNLRRQRGYLPVDSLADRPTPTQPAKPPICANSGRRNGSPQQELDLGR